MSQVKNFHSQRSPNNFQISSVLQHIQALQFYCDSASWMLRSLLVKTSFFYLSHNDHSGSKTLPLSKTLSLSRNADEHFRSCDDGCFHWVHSRADDGSDLFTCKWRSRDAFLSNLFHLSSKWDFKADFQNNLRQRCYLHPKLVDGVDTQTSEFQRWVNLSYLRNEELKALLVTYTSGSVKGKLLGFFSLKFQSLTLIHHHLSKLSKNVFTVKWGNIWGKNHWT